MVEKGLYDKAADEIVRRYGLVKNEIIRRNKGKKPFRKEIVSPKEQLFNFSQMTEQDIMTARQQFGDEAMDNFLLDMDEIARRYK